MSKLPAFQFYPSDWRSDPGIQALSFEDRGIWFEILCLMHESPRRGVLLLPNGSPMSSVALGRILGIPTPKMVKALDRIGAVGVSDREADTGALINRRMVRDEHIRQVRAVAGKLGGNPNLVKQNESKTEANAEQDTEHNRTPSSSSSVSSSTSNQESPPEVPKKSAPTGPPKEFEITDNMREWANAEGFDNASIERETAAMLDHFRSSGKRKHDWIATWRNWLRNSRRFGGKHGVTKTTASDANRRAAQDFVSRKLAETVRGDIPNVR